MSDLRDIYEEIILEHNRHPRNYPKKPDGANHTAYGFNPLCGDEFHIHLRIEEGIIKDVGFEGAGCAISTASASLMTEALVGRNGSEAEELFNNMHRFLTDEAGDTGVDKKLAVLGGVKEYPMRVKCATLAWHTMHAAMEDKEGTICTE